MLHLHSPEAIPHDSIQQSILKTENDRLLKLTYAVMDNMLKRCQRVIENPPKKFLPILNSSLSITDDRIGNLVATALHDINNPDDTKGYINTTITRTALPGFIYSEVTGHTTPDMQEQHFSVSLLISIRSKYAPLWTHRRPPPDWMIRESLTQLAWAAAYVRHIAEDRYALLLHQAAAREIEMRGYNV